MAYLDAVIVHVNSFDNHLCNIRYVLLRSRQHNLKLKQKKMVFVQKGATDFLARAVSEDYVSVTTERTYCVAQWPFPRNRKDMDTF